MAVQQGGREMNDDMSTGHATERVDDADADCCQASCECDHCRHLGMCLRYNKVLRSCFWTALAGRPYEKVIDG